MNISSCFSIKSTLEDVVQSAERVQKSAEGEFYHQFLNFAPETFDFSFNLHFIVIWIIHWKWTLCELILFVEIKIKFSSFFKLCRFGKNYLKISIENFKFFHNTQNGIEEILQSKQAVNSQPGFLNLLALWLLCFIS